MSGHVAHLPGRLAGVLAPGLLAGGGALEPVETRLSDSGLDVPARWSARAAAGMPPTTRLADFAEPKLLALVDEAVAANYDLRARIAGVARCRTAMFTSLTTFAGLARLIFEKSTQA